MPVTLDQIKLTMQGISTLATLIKLYREFSGRGETPPPAKIDQAVAQAPAVSQATASSLAACISDSTLQAINAVIDRARKRFEEALRDPANNKQSRDAEEQIAQSTICGELKRIKRLNSGKLPPEYDDDWAEFSCA